jgi:hypothetical protein
MSEKNRTTFPRTAVLPIPRNARDAVLRGVDLHAASFTADDAFLGPHLILRRGTVQPDITNGEPRFEIPFVAHVRFGRPRPVAKGGRS